MSAHPRRRHAVCTMTVDCPIKCIRRVLRSPAAVMCSPLAPATIGYVPVYVFASTCLHWQVIIYNRQSTVTEGQAPFAEVHTLDGHVNAITSVDFSPVSDRLLCSASLDTYVRVWRCSTHDNEWSCIKRVWCVRARVCALVYAHTGTHPTNHRDLFSPPV
jgi:WD40 repeat protein